MKCTGLVALFMGHVLLADSLETQVERRIRRHKKHQSSAGSTEPLVPLSQLLQRSAELTKQFESNANALRQKVQDVEEGSDSDTVSSFVELGKGPLDASLGLKAMGEVTEEIMRYTDKMRRMSNDVSLFSANR
jgi:hypothetical protein